MNYFATAALVLGALTGFTSHSTAQSYTSAYTKLIFDQNCRAITQVDDGVVAKCDGYIAPGAPASNEWPVYFSEGDLRQMVRFGHLDNPLNDWQSFTQFNSVGETIEWRLSGGTPFATILRWHIEIENPNTGHYDKSSAGQVLVISTIAGYDTPDNACVAGYVDAKANRNANVLARRVADTVAQKFSCKMDTPIFYGNRGRSSGSPTHSRE